MDSDHTATPPSDERHSYELNLYPGLNIKRMHAGLSWAELAEEAGVDLAVLRGLTAGSGRRATVEEITALKAWMELTLEEPISLLPPVSRRRERKRLGNP